jgi:hypothetical protein
MRPQRGTDRRQNQSGPPAGQADRRCGDERRKLQLTAEAIARLEARLAALAPDEEDEVANDGSGWDKLVIPVK